VKGEARGAFGVSAFGVSACRRVGEVDLVDLVDEVDGVDGVDGMDA
jgi:hypothetical protein